jgi:hypothetical protein
MWSPPSTSEFFLVREAEAVPVRSVDSIVRTEQVPEERNVELARPGTT